MDSPSLKGTVRSQTCSASWISATALCAYILSSSADFFPQPLLKYFYTLLPHLSIIASNHSLGPNNPASGPQEKKPPFSRFKSSEASPTNSSLRFCKSSILEYSPTILDWRVTIVE